MTATRKNIMLGTAGHVDHGKTAVVKILTGCNTDTLAEEQRRGLTIDLGFAPCRMADERIVGIVDVPGHVDFIRNMVAGAHGIDVVIFVVAADDGVMPQTREHLDILTLMGVRGGIVALTKIDLVAADMRELVTEDVRGLLAGTFLAQAPICPVSNITGEGYEGLLAAMNAAVDACPQRSTNGLFRTWVEDVYAIHGFGTVVTGIPVSGEVAVGDHLAVLPGGLAARVRKLEVYGQEQQVGRAGECVAINLSDVQGAQVARGMSLGADGAFGPVTLAEAELTMLPRAGRPLKDYAQVHLHVGTAECTARVAMLESKDIASGQSRMVQLRLDRPLGASAGDRFVIRTDLGGPTAGRLTTVGGGRILSVSNVRLRRNRPWTLEALAQRQGAIDNPVQWVEVSLRQSAKPLDVAQLAAAAQMKPPEVEAAVAAGMQGGTILALGGGVFVHAEATAELSRRAVAELEAFHAANPLRLGMEEGVLVAALGAHKALTERVLADLLAKKTVLKQGPVILLAGKGAQLSPADRQLCEGLLAALEGMHLQPQYAADLAVTLGAAAARVDKMLRLLADGGTIVKLDATLFMHASAVAAARKVVLDLFAKAESFETVQFRDALGVSRKWAVPLLDYFDTVRLTARSGNRRRPGAAAKAAMEPK